MKIQIEHFKASIPKSSLLVIPISKTALKNKSPLFLKLDTALNKHLSTLIQNKEISDKKDHCCLVHTPTLSCQRLLFIGMGEGSKLDDIRHQAGFISRFTRDIPVSEIHVLFSEYCSKQPKNDEVSKLISAFIEGLILGAYEFEVYKTEKKEKKKNLSHCTFLSPIALKNSEEIIHTALTLAHANNIARTYANQPSNVLTPSAYVDIIKKELGKNIDIEILDEKKAEKKGMGLFLSVAKGSCEKPFMVKLSYQGGNPKEKPIVLVGKGVTFDSGGISIKPAASMSEMKGDMSGSAAVVAALHAIGQLKPKKNVIGIIALVENMPSATALKPGDIITSYLGKTVEILNTDAEGRLILADALTWASEHDPELIIDIATLTGACTVALGEVYAAIIGNHAKSIQTFKKISEETGERVWHLPDDEGYLEYLKSDVADLANCYEGRSGDTCSAAKFLEQFVNKKPWIHIDMASKMLNKKTKGYEIKGMSGFGARTLVEFILQESHFFKI